MSSSSSPPHAAASSAIVTATAVTTHRFFRFGLICTPSLSRPQHVAATARNLRNPNLEQFHSSRGVWARRAGPFHHTASGWTRRGFHSISVNDGRRSQGPGEPASRYCERRASPVRHAQSRGRRVAPPYAGRGLDLRVRTDGVRRATPGSCPNGPDIRRPAALPPVVGPQGAHGQQHHRRGRQDHRPRRGRGKYRGAGRRPLHGGLCQPDECPGSGGARRAAARYRLHHGDGRVRGRVAAGGRGVRHRRRRGVFRHRPVSRLRPPPPSPTRRTSRQRRRQGCGRRTQTRPAGFRALEGSQAR